MAKAIGVDLAKLNTDLTNILQQHQCEKDEAEGVKKAEPMSHLVMFGRNLGRFGSRLEILKRRSAEGVKLAQQEELRQLDLVLQAEIGKLYRLQLTYGQGFFPMSWLGEYLPSAGGRKSCSKPAPAALQSRSLSHSLTNPRELGLPAPDPEALKVQVARLEALGSLRDTWLAWLENWQPEGPFPGRVLPALSRCSAEGLAGELAGGWRQGRLHARNVSTVFRGFSMCFPVA